MALAGLIGAQIVFAATPPVARFTWSPDPGHIDETITFDASTSSDDGSITTYQWDFNGGGGFEATGISATRSFSAPGSYPVRLQVTDNDGETDTLIKNVTVVNRPPVASIAGPTHAQIGDHLTYTASASDPDNGDSITAYEWDLGTGSFAAGGSTSPQAVFSSGGDKTIRVRVTDEHGGTTIASLVVHVNFPPIARIAFSALNLEPGQDIHAPLIGQPVGFASQSSDPDGTVEHYLWAHANLGEPRGVIGGDASAVVYGGYATAGDKQVALQVTDNEGAKSPLTPPNPEALAVVHVNTRPTADFNYSPLTPAASDEITFSQAASDPDSGSNGSLTAYQWDLDGNASTGPDGFEKSGASVKAKFDPGSHTVRMRVIDGGGARSFAASKTVVVQKNRPRSAFAFDPPSPVAGQSVAFKSWASPSDGDHNIVKQEWDFDFDPGFDPTKDKFVADAEGANVKHTFSTPGEKLVALKVTESGGGFDIATHTVVVRAAGQGVLSGKLSVIGMTVQISGRTTRRGAKLTLLQVRTPVGAMVKLRCKGRRCPIHSKRVESKSGRVRFKKFERKLRAGTKIIIEATLDGFIGKRVVFKIRKGKAPLRKDRCIQPGASRPSACPG